MTSPSAALRALIVDDDAADRDFLAAELHRSGFQCQVDFAKTLDEVRRRLDAGRYDVALADYRLGAGAAPT